MTITEEIIEEIIEAGAQAMCAIRFPRVHWSKLPAVPQVMAIDEARACLTAALAALPEPLRRAVVLARHTGQRRGDLCAMRWDAYDGTTLRVRQQKTGAELVLPVPPALRVELDAWRQNRATLTILDDGQGAPWVAQRLTERLARALAKLGMAGLGIHGVRKHRAADLADHGASTHEIAAITGHRTLGMVALYTASADQQRLAQQAVARLSKKRGADN
jgi:integrase